MAQAAWEKPLDSNLDDKRAQLLNKSNERWKYLIGGLLLVGAIIYLILSGTVFGARYYVTVDEVVHNARYHGQPVRLSGVVLGDTISVDTSDPGNTIIQFTIANVPEGYSNLAEALHLATLNPEATRLKVYVAGQPKPELLQHEAQAILHGRLGEDGVFYASEMMFKCPSRFEDGGPQVGSEMDHPGFRSEVSGDAG